MIDGSASQRRGMQVRTKEGWPKWWLHPAEIGEQLRNVRRITQIYNQSDNSCLVEEGFQCTIIRSTETSKNAGVHESKRHWTSLSFLTWMSKIKNTRIFRRFDMLTYMRNNLEASKPKMKVWTISLSLLFVFCLWIKFESSILESIQF